MDDHKGFTIVELLVATALLALVVAAAASFFRYQSAYGKYLSKEKSFREEVSMAMFMIRNDIMNAGYAVADERKLALYVDGGGTDYYEKLFINFGKCIEENLTTSAYLPSVFKKYAYSSGADLQSFMASYLDGKYSDNDTTALLIGLTDGAGYVTNVSWMGLDYSPAGGGKFTESGSTDDNYLYAPAVSYELKDKCLKRNGQIILGGGPLFEVTGFYINVQFIDAALATFWVPDPVKGGFSSQDPTGLRRIKVETRYRFKRGETRKEGGSWLPQWSPTFSRIMHVAPRTLILSAY